MDIIKFEWKKLWKSKIYLIILLVTIAFIVGLFIRNYYYQDIVKTEKVETFQAQGSVVITQFIGDQQLLRNDTQAVDPNLEVAIEAGKALYAKIQELVAAVDMDEHLAALDLEIEVYELAMEYQALERSFPLSKTEMENEIRLNEELLRQELPKEALNASIQPAVFMKQVVQLVLNSIGFFLIIIIIGIPIVRAFDDHSIKLSYPLPVSAKSMVLAKWVSMSISAGFWFAVVLGTSYGISTLFGKEEMKAFQYPFFVVDDSFITAGSYLGQTLLFGVIYILMLTAFFIMLTFLLKNTLVVQISFLLLFIMNFIMIQNGVIFASLPWSYQELNVAILQQQGIAWIGLLFSILITGILLLLAIRASKRREFRL